MYTFTKTIDFPGEGKYANLFCEIAAIIQIDLKGEIKLQSKREVGSIQFEGQPEQRKPGTYQEREIQGTNFW